MRARDLEAKIKRYRAWRASHEKRAFGDPIGLIDLLLEDREVLIALLDCAVPDA